MMTDPIADMLTRIRNAGMARSLSVTMPASKLKRSILEVLQEEGYINDLQYAEVDGHPALTVRVLYKDEGTTLIEGLRRVSRPGRRVYVAADSVKKVRNGVGRAVLSTSKGVVTDVKARELSVGGEVLCEVW
jgi:small subunit ribosomal protein S8